MVTYEDKMLEERAQGKREGIQIGEERGRLGTINDIQSLVDGGMTLEEAFETVKKSAKTQ